MRHTDRHRIRRKYEYIKGCLEMLSWVQMENPCDLQIEIKIDGLKAILEDLKKELNL
jgi:hypothetical protein